MHFIFTHIVWCGGLLKLINTFTPVIVDNIGEDDIDEVTHSERAYI